MKPLERFGIGFQPKAVLGWVFKTDVALGHMVVEENIDSGVTNGEFTAIDDQRSQYEIAIGIGLQIE